MKTVSTKKAFLMSVLSVLVCFTMLLGTTFAWFTDSVTSTNNKIVAGNLKIDLELLDKATGNWNSIKDSKAPLFSEDSLWEPGYTEVKILKVENEGSLALKWKATFSSSVALSALADVLDVYVKVGQNSYPERADLAGWTKSGTVREFVEKIESTTYGTLTAKGTAGAEAYLGLAVKMREEANNDYQNMSIGAFDITILATQLASEKDSFDELYDANASYPGEANSASELLEALNGNMNVKLGANIDLTGIAWTPIASYSGNFDGAGHTISGLKGENGLFDELSGATIKNLNLANVDIDATSNHTGAVAGYIVKSQGKQTVIDNVTVSGTVNGGDYYVGGLVGADSNYDTVIKNSTNNATVVANGQQVGGIVGYATRKTIIENCVNNGNVTGGSFVGGIIGMASGDDDMPERSIIVKDCVNNGDVAETATGPAVTWQGGVGGIIGNVGRAAGDSAVKMLNFYIIDCDVKDGQAVYGQKHNVLGGHDNLLSVYVGTAVASEAGLLDAVKAAENGAETVLYLTGDTYSGDVKFTVDTVGSNKTGKILFKAADGVTPVFTGCTTIGFYERLNNASTKFNADIIFDGVTFDQAEAGKHSLDVQAVGSITLENCKVIGGGEYGIGSAAGNNTGPSRITNCTFENAGMQVLGNFGKDLVIEGCTFTESCINVQGGVSVTVKECEFTNTLTDAHINESFYVIRSNAIPITVTNCVVRVDSTVTGIAANQLQWGIFWNRGNGTDWTVTDVEVTLTAAAIAQTELDVTKCAAKNGNAVTGKINTNNLTVNGVVQ